MNKKNIVQYIILVVAAIACQEDSSLTRQFDFNTDLIPGEYNCSVFNNGPPIDMIGTIEQLDDNCFTLRIDSSLYSYPEINFFVDNPRRQVWSTYNINICDPSDYLLDTQPGRYSFIKHAGDPPSGNSIVWFQFSIIYSDNEIFISGQREY